MPADDLALLAHRLDRRSYLHGPFRFIDSTGWLWLPVRLPLPSRDAGRRLAAPNATSEYSADFGPRLRAPDRPRVQVRRPRFRHRAIGLPERRRRAFRHDFPDEAHDRCPPSPERASRPSHCRPPRWPTRSTRPSNGVLADSAVHQHALGDDRRCTRAVHARRADVPRSGHVADEERRHARAEGADRDGGRGDGLLRGRLRVRVRQRRHHRHDRVPAARLRRSADRVRDHGPVGRADRVQVAVPVRVLRRLPRDRVGLDARADQVPRARDLRARVRRAHLPAGVALGVRRRLAADERRHAGLRGLDGGPPRRRHRRAGRADRARRPPRQVRPRRRAAADPGPQHADPRARHVHPADRLVRLQRRLDAGRDRRALRRGRDGDDARRGGRHPRRIRRHRGAAADGRHRDGLQRPDRRPRRDHRRVGLRRELGGADHRPRRRPDRRAEHPADRAQARRPGRRALRARPRGHLGHARVRPVHGAAVRAVRRDRQPRRRPRVLGLVRAARLPGARRGRRVRARARALPGDLVRDRQDDRAAGQRRGRDGAGLDISEHGMYGYPEQFIPDAELYGVAAAPAVKLGGRAPSPAPATARRKPPRPDPLPRGFGGRRLGRRPRPGPGVALHSSAGARLRGLAPGAS